MLKNDVPAVITDLFVKSVSKCNGVSLFTFRQNKHNVNFVIRSLLVKCSKASSH